ncbi:hypothetical protein [Larkinella soli]|uniref:hypothetical protein n=1 Tax=Larkinella soli TaxID=1770527 RepID=UPI000FFC99BD|nr:hypothetical protein [Larkinella soli]
MKASYLTMFRPTISGIFICILIFSCTCNFEVTHHSHSLDVDLATARSWFERTYTGNLGDSGDLHRTLFWKDAYEYRNRNDATKAQMVVVPIVHKKEGVYSGFKHLWIYRDKNGKMVSKVVEYIQDLKEWAKKPTDFRNYTGVILFRNWENQFLIGLTLKNNIITGVVGEVDTGGGLEKATPVSNPQTRKRGVICGINTLCQNWTIDVMGFIVHGTNCQTGYNCVMSEYALDPAFTGITYDVPSGSAGAWIIFDPKNVMQPILPYGPPSETRMGFSNNPCGGYLIMQAHQKMVQREMSAYVTTDGKVFILPYALNEVHDCYWPGEVRDISGQIIFRVDLNVMTSKYEVTYYDWSQRTSQTWELAALVHTHPIEPGYDHLNPSPKDKKAAASYPGIRHQIVTGNRLLTFTPNGVVSNERMPCLN